MNINLNNKHTLFVLSNIHQNNSNLNNSIASRFFLNNDILFDPYIVIKSMERLNIKSLNVHVITKNVEFANTWPKPVIYPTEISNLSISVISIDYFRAFVDSPLF